MGTDRRTESPTSAAEVRLFGELTRARCEIDRLRAALEFYASPEQYGRHGDAIADGGDVARKALGR